MKHLVGIDGGGTNSRLLATDLQGRVLAELRGKSTNPESNPFETVEANLRKLLERFWGSGSQDRNDCAALCFGTAGVDTRSTQRQVQELLERLGLRCPVQAANDAEIALFANTRGGPGLLLNAGTGSVGYGVNGKGESFRVGGFGYLVGDEGSAYWVAREGICAALHAFDRTGRETCLQEELGAALGLGEFSEIIDYVYRSNKSDLAKLNRVVSRAASRGDRAAADIMHRAADYLLTAVETLLRELMMAGSGATLYLEGGFLLNSPALRKELVSALLRRHPRLSVSDMKRPAQWGALYMAAQLAGLRDGWDCPALSPPC